MTISSLHKPASAVLPVHVSGEGGGTLVISLDFELMWGVHDSRGALDSYAENLHGAREAVPRMLDVFEEYSVGVTWATVGFLFAEGREEVEHFSPAIKPTYQDPVRDPYRIKFGENERHAPLQYAPSLIRLIAQTPNQEIASHTFSHYYALEPGQTEEQFRADLAAARAIASAKGYDVRSLVMPRRQSRRDYFKAISDEGFFAHRTAEGNHLNKPSATGTEPKMRRTLRLLDTYFSITGPNEVPWASTEPDANGLVDVRESRFLRPVNGPAFGLEPMRVQRVVSAMRAAAAQGSICHIWWHPHNFGVNLDQNLANLRRVLDYFVGLREEGLMRSLTMGQIAEIRRSRVRNAVQVAASV